MGVMPPFIFNFMKDICGHIAETNQKVGDYPPGFQVIICSVISEGKNPHLLVEAKGRKGSVHLNEINIFEERFESYELHKNKKKKPLPGV